MRARHTTGYFGDQRIPVELKRVMDEIDATSSPTCSTTTWPRDWACRPWPAVMRVPRVQLR
ncbi:hypothetical protein [Halomonas sp. M4R1S46]|uniref:hypothetical protein n=1 Tax=Halomonas sp. M4R1S46 TaxID=2982692 RepID=UPI0021E3E508|nr:hypothetical protein [Halomonas sp. M4R1S46]UYG06650.1 hypothetical protein OCT48_13585 [Halomonas sp. M4R1S46]